MSETKQRSFAHSIAWNLAGAGIPLVFAFFAIPILLSGYGNARFGFLTIAWSLIGYFSIFDFGMGRALTKVVADRLGSGRKEEIPKIAFTALSIMFLLGILAALLMAMLAPNLTQLLKIDQSLFDESVNSIRILAIAIPFVIVSAGLIGLLEAHSEFQSINTIRLVMGLLNFASPLATLHWSHSLVPATISLAITRCATSCLYFFSATRLNILQVGNSHFHSPYIKELLSFGGWITVDNLVSPLMSQLDKMVIGGLIALSLLPFYSVPGDLVNRLSFAPIAMIGVFFPTFASRWAAGEQSSIPSLFSDACKVMYAVIFPVAIALYVLAPEGLGLWMGKDFSAQSAPLLRWLCIGLFVSSIARIPNALLQAIGKPGVAAKMHLLELFIYAPALWLLLDKYSVRGAALAWSGRMILDFFLLSACATIVVPGLRKPMTTMLLSLLAGSIAMVTVALMPSLPAKLALCVLIAIAGCVCALKTLLRLQHRD